MMTHYNYDDVVNGLRMEGTAGCDRLADVMEALQAECERLRAELAAAQRQRDDACVAWSAEAAKCRDLTIDLAAAQKDAERYRWLRRSFRLEKAYDIYKDGGRWWTAFHVADNRLSVDAAIDAAMQEKRDE